MVTFELTQDIQIINSRNIQLLVTQDIQKIYKNIIYTN